MFHRCFKTVRGICLCAAYSILVACVSGDTGDLDQFMQEVLARPGGNIEPIPEIAPYEAYVYQSGKRQGRDPFLSFYQKTVQQLAEEKEGGLTEEQKDEIMNRNKEELEQFELDSLRMVGTIENSGEQWAIIALPDGGGVSRVTEGNYIGRNTGKILNIFENKIEIREIIKDGQGRWRERQAALTLEE